MRRFSRAGIFCVLPAFLLLVPLTPTRGADPLRDETSLRFIPANVDFYCSFLRGREQYDAFVSSNAYKQMKELPYVKDALKKLDEQLKNPFSPAGLAWAALQTEEAKKSLRFLADMMSHEVFVIGDQKYAELLDLLMEINQAQRMAQLESAFNGGDDAEVAVAKAILDVLDDHRDKLAAPNTVIGFRITDKKLAESQFKLLTKALEGAFADAPPELKGRMKEKKIGGTTYVTVELDGKLVPWDDIPLDAVADKEGDYDKLMKKLKSLQLKIALGLRDDYMLLSIGRDYSQLEGLGEGKLLIDRKELKPVRDRSMLRYVSICYGSERLAAAADGFRQIEDAFDQLRLVARAMDVEKDLEERLEADLERLKGIIRDRMPPPSAGLSFEFLNEQGYEGYRYYYTAKTPLDASKPLSLLSHVGGNPLMLLVAREKTSPDDYDLAVTILKRTFQYGEEIALSKMDEEEKAKFKKIKKEVLPILKDLHEVTRDKVVPALSSGQSGFVIDSKLEKRSWCQYMPAAEKPLRPLPLPEMALVMEVTDAEKLRQAGPEYMKILRRAMKKLRKAAKDSPEAKMLKIPDPQKVRSERGEIHQWALPKDWKVSQEIGPTIALSDQVLVMSTGPDVARRLLKPTPVMEGGPLDKAGKPLSVAAHFDWPLFVDTAVPWVEYGIWHYYSQQEEEAEFDIALGDGEKQGDEKEADKKDAKKKDKPAISAKVKDLIKQVRATAKILKCWRGVSAVTYEEKGATVTHFLWRMEDLK